jgi:hypothetical protein
LSLGLRRWALRGLAFLVLLVAGLTLVAWLSRPWLEARVAARLEAAARKLGATSSVESVRLGLWPPLRLAKVSIEKPDQWTLAVDEAAVAPRWSLHALGLRLGALHVTHRSGLALDAPPTRWLVAGGTEAGRVVLEAPSEGLAIAWTAGAEQLWSLRAERLAAGEVFRLRRGEGSLLDAGVVDGAADLTRTDGVARVTIDLRARGLRVGSVPEPWARGSAEPTYGLPSDGALRLEGTWNAAEGTLEVPRFRLMAGGADLSGALALTDVTTDPQIDLSLAVDRVDFARVFGSSGIEPPRALAFQPGSPGALDLGAASLQARVRGHVRDARSFTVSQKLDFTKPPHPIPALERLRGDFETEVTTAGGARRVILVSPESPDFIPLPEVPPLFVKTLLLAEDTSFFGHRGIDLSEIPPALITNWERGGVARGASTITQQLAKNLFLSRDKNVGRKLQELCLSLLLESTLPKERILEIYLNVIEWGPDLYGLRPAARRYFDKEPKELTPREIAFLVALIPGPVKYQRSFADGTLSPGFRPLVDELLAKVHSVGGLSDQEYDAARAEALAVRTAASVGPEP